MRLIKKIENKPVLKVTIWCEEKNGKDVIQRKLFTAYNTTIKEIEALILSQFKELGK